MNVTDSTATAVTTATERLRVEWPAVRALWKSAVSGAFASVGADGSPHVAPIGSVYLHPTEPRGYYHPILTARLRKDLTERAQFELLFVQPRALPWLVGLLRGRFEQPIAVRLRGRALGPRRPTTEAERAHFQRRVRWVRWTRGYELLWKDIRFVQELAFEDVVPIRLGAMPNG